MSSIRSLMLLMVVGIRDLLKVSDTDIAAALGKFADQGLRDGVISDDDAALKSLFDSFWNDPQVVEAQGISDATKAELQETMAKNLLCEGMASTGIGGKIPAYNSAEWNRLWDAINHRLNESGAQNLDSAISEWDKSYSYGKDGVNPR